jgi:cation transport protein ChaC
VYRETYVKLRLLDGREVTALAYVVNRSHADYAGRLPEQELLDHALEARGNKGSCRDYVVSTHAHLLSLGVRDAHLASLAERLGMPSEPQAAHRHHDMAHNVETAIH